MIARGSWHTRAVEGSEGIVERLMDWKLLWKLFFIHRYMNMPEEQPTTLNAESGIRWGP